MASHFNHTASRLNAVAGSAWWAQPQNYVGRISSDMKLISFPPKYTVCHKCWEKIKVVLLSSPPKEEKIEEEEK